MTVLVELTPPTVPPAETDQVEIIDDLEALSEDGRCSCAASDDNPY
jgi:hypothetical protein